MNEGIWTEAYRRGDHIIQVYSSEKERLRTVCEILDWINDDEMLIYIVDDLGLDSLSGDRNLIEDRIREGIASGRMRVTRSTPFYLDNGGFDLRARISAWEEVIKGLMTEGYSSLVVVGDLSWSSKHPGLFSQVLRYEATLSMAGLPKGFTAVCQYDSRLFDQKEIDYLESVHELQLKEGIIQRNFWLVSQRYY